jgi:hypothetical protein
MTLVTPRLFPETDDLDSHSLFAALYRHAWAVEDALLAAGQQPGESYTALGVLRIAASLLAIPDDPNGSRPWTLPEIRRPARGSRPEWRFDDFDPDLPF